MGALSLQHAPGFWVQHCHSMRSHNASDIQENEGPSLQLYWEWHTDKESTSLTVSGPEWIRPIFPAPTDLLEGIRCRKLAILIVGDFAEEQGIILMGKNGCSHFERQFGSLEKMPPQFYPRTPLSWSQVSTWLTWNLCPHETAPQWLWGFIHDGWNWKQVWNPSTGELINSLAPQVM